MVPQPERVMTDNTDYEGDRVSPEFKAQVAKAFTPIEELIETLWEQLDELASLNDRSEP